MRKKLPSVKRGADWPHPRHSKGHDLSRRPHRAGAKHPCEKCRLRANLSGEKV